MPMTIHLWTLNISCNFFYLGLIAFKYCCKVIYIYILNISTSRWHSSRAKQVQIICYPTFIPCSHAATLLKPAPLFDQHMLESVLSLVHVLYLAAVHSQFQELCTSLCLKLTYRDCFSL